VSAVKLAGAMLLVSAGAAAGMKKRMELHRHVLLLTNLISALSVMEEEIATLQTPLPDVFSSLAVSASAELRDFFASLSEKAGRVPMNQLWMAQVQALPLTEDERQTLCALSLILGHYDAQHQGGEIALARRRLETALSQTKERQNGVGRTYLALGVSLGAMLAVILF
jgi:stage III sporulation protein AB